MEFEQTDEGVIDIRGVVLQNSDPIAVHALCLGCAHKWKLRVVRQITNLVAHPAHPAHKPAKTKAAKEPRQ